MNGLSAVQSVPASTATTSATQWIGTSNTSVQQGMGPDNSCYFM